MIMAAVLLVQASTAFLGLAARQGIRCASVTACSPADGGYGGSGGSGGRWSQYRGQTDGYSRSSSGSDGDFDIGSLPKRRVSGYRRDGGDDNGYRERRGNGGYSNGGYGSGGGGGYRDRGYSGGYRDRGGGYDDRGGYNDRDGYGSGDGYGGGGYRERRVGGGAGARERRDTRRQEQGANVKPGDWTCPTCGVNVFASKARCFKCPTLNPDPVARAAAASRAREGGRGVPPWHPDAQKGPGGPWEWQGLDGGEDFEANLEEDEAAFRAAFGPARSSGIDFASYSEIPVEAGPAGWKRALYPVRGQRPITPPGGSKGAG
jgi:hypothetical protein